MPNQINATNITPPRVPLIDERTGLISREWYRFFLNLFTLTGSGTNQVSLVDLQLGPPPLQLESITVDPSGATINPSDSPLTSQIAEIQKQINALQETPDCDCTSLAAQLQTLANALEATPQPQLGTMAQLEQANIPWLTFATSPQSVPTSVGTMAWDGGTTMGLQATANVLIRVGEAEYVYAKASSAVTKGQLCYHTGAVGASGVITVAPTPLSLSDSNQIVGVAAESIALNGFGLIQVSGDLRGFNTTGSSVGETWADGDPLYYNPAYVGSMTKTKPSAPNQKTYVGEVINAATSGSGSMSIRITPGSVLGGTDSNVQFSSLANGDLIQYDSALQYWKNVPSSMFGTGTVTSVSVSSANGFAGTVATATTTPAITLSTSISGLLYGNGTALAAATISSPLTYSAGTLSIPAATSSVNGYLSSTDWSTFNGKQTAYTNLTSIGSLANGAGWLYNNGSGTFSYSTPTKSDVGLGNVTNDVQTKAAIVPNTAPSAGQLLVGNAGGTAYAPVVMSGDATIASTGAITVSKFNGGTTFGSAAGYAATAFQAAGTYVTSVSGTSPIISSGGATPAISISQATSSTNGYLSSTDWSTFNAKQPVAAPATKTGDFTVAATEVWLINNKSGSTCTVTLPTASSYSGRVLHFQNYQAQTLVSASSNVVPLAGGSAATAILAAVAGDTATLVSDGTNWIMTQYVPNNVLLLE